MDSRNTRKTAGKTWIDLIMALLAAAYATAFMVVWRTMGSVDYSGGVSTFVSVLSPKHAVLFFGLFIVLYMFVRGCRRSGGRLADFVYKWRYGIGAAVVAVAVALKVSGSSVHAWAYYIPSDANGTVLGQTRLIRSDEWFLNTAFAFAQAASGFKYFSPVIGGGMDAFIVYGQPVLDIGVIFRPFHWGYLLLGAERGLSFFWMARLVALALVSFDLGMLILKNKRGLALMLALMICFSPFVQWWFAINGLVEMLVFGFSAILLFNRYLQTNSYARRAAYGAIIAWLGCAYVLTFYPAWIVPVAYILLALAVWIVLQNRRTMTLTGKDALVLAEAVALMALGLGYVFLKSRETVRLVMNTAYPGKRMDTGLVDIRNLFVYASGLFSALKGASLGTYENEIASFISFFPLGLVLFVFHSIRRRRVDALSLGLVIVSAFFGLYCFVGFPEPLLNLTLMRFTATGRALPLLMLAQLLMLFREMAIAGDSLASRYTVSLTVIVSAMITVGARICLPEYYSAKMLAILFAVSAGVCLTAFLIGKYPQMIWTLTVCVVSAALAGGLFVNPVQIGAGEIMDNQITRLVEPIVQADPEACWIVEKSPPFTNVIVPVGARTINATNVYPHMDLWKRLDRDGAYEDVYNRYAHITVQLVGEETRFEYGIARDQFVLCLNPNDLPLLDVEYILTENDLEALNTESVRFEQVSSKGSFRVYHVLYEKTGEDAPARP